MTGAAVTVTDRTTYSAVVSPAQAVAYCRRMLTPAKGYREVEDTGPPGVWLHFVDHEGAWASVPLLAHAPYYSAHVTELVYDLVRLGVATKPSDVLRAMAQEEAGK